MLVASFQGRCALRDAKRNIATTIEALQKADQKGADVLCMPEAFLHGYFDIKEESEKNSIDLTGPLFSKILSKTKGFKPMLFVGLIERRSRNFYNTVVVIHNGSFVGKYSKAFPIYPFFTPGRDFPIFHCGDVPFGIVICADGGYTEPTRILAMKGARIIFAPHYNYIKYDRVYEHILRVRADHIARAVENKVYWVRSNVIWPGLNSGTKYAGLGVGDSYILDRRGRVMVEAGYFRETILYCDIPDNDLLASADRFIKQPDPRLYEIMLEVVRSSISDNIRQEKNERFEENK